MIEGAVKGVSGQREVLRPEKTKYRVALWDFGAKRNIARELVKRSCEVVIMPSGSTAEELCLIHIFLVLVFVLVVCGAVFLSRRAQKKQAENPTASDGSQNDKK